MIGIVDYGMGNLRSVFNAFEMVGAEVSICDQPSSLAQMDRIVLPGVGAFRDCITNLRQKGFVEVLQQEVLQKRKPILGICLGMQLMARKSYEDGEYDGLGWFDAEVVRITPHDPLLKVPQIGWNNLELKSDHFLFKDLPESADVYFVHSYHMQCKNDDNLIAVCDYSIEVTAAVGLDNIVATQFHPEKSQEVGLNILENFAKWNP